MRNTIWPVSLSLALMASSANGIEMTDYKDPTSTWEEAYLTGSFNSKSGNQGQTSYDLTLDAFYEHNFSSLPRTWQFHIDGETDVSRGAEKDDDTEDNTQANLRANIDTYFKNKTKTFWFGETETNYRDDRDNAKIEVSAGIGYGRVINATPLAKVLRIEEELREHGVILGRITDEQYLELAQIIDRENEYRGKFGPDEYKSHWISDFEEVLKRIGVLRDEALGAIGVLQMDRVLFDNPPNTRKHGWLVRAGVGYLVQDFEGDESDPSLVATYEYTHPSGYKGQFINRLDYSTVIGDDTRQFVSNVMSFSHDISDRVSWINTWRLDWEIYEGDREDVVTNGLSTIFRYYLANRITANATVSATKVDDGIDYDPNDATTENNDDVDVTTFFSVSYRLK